MLINGISANDISKQLSIKYSLINNLISNNTWRTVIVDGWDEYRKNRNTYHRLSKEDHQNIYRLYIEQNYDKQELAKMYNKHISTIDYILKTQSKVHDNPVPSS